MAPLLLAKLALDGSGEKAANGLADARAVTRGDSLKVPMEISGNASGDGNRVFQECHDDASFTVEQK
jgi:hypothetical protein